MPKRKEIDVSRINVNLNHVKRFFEDSLTMMKSSTSINEGEVVISSLIKRIENERQSIERLIHETQSRKSNVSATIGQLKAKIAELQCKIGQKETELANLQRQALVTLNVLAQATLSGRIMALQAEIASLKARLYQCQSICQQFQTVKSSLESSVQNLTNLSAKLNNAKLEFRSLLKNLSQAKETSINLCDRAVQILERIINVTHKYINQTIKKGAFSSGSSQMATRVYKKYPTRIFYSAKDVDDFRMSIDDIEDLTEEEKMEILDNKKAYEGSIIYLQYLGVDLDSLDNAKTYDDQKNILVNSGFKPEQAKQIISIYNGDFLSDIDGSHSPFYSNAPQSSGDSYEFQRFFVNLRDKKETAKEVPFDLTPYKGRACTFLGYNEKLENDRRETDVVRFEGNREIHEELKVGRVYGKEGDAKFRQELYGDDLRLKLNPNQEQEYRIRRNGNNMKCLLDDKEKVRCLYVMAKRHPNKVRVYFNDTLMSLRDMEKIINKHS